MVRKRGVVTKVHWGFTLDKEVFEKFQEICWKRRIKMSPIVNELVKKWLEENS